MTDGGRTETASAVRTARDTLETYVLAPLIDRKTIYLPPALTVLAQLTMAVFAGLLGVALATPILAIGVVLVRAVYVEDILGDEIG